MESQPRDPWVCVLQPPTERPAEATVLFPFWSHQPAQPCSSFGFYCLRCPWHHTNRLPVPRGWRPWLRLHRTTVLLPGVDPAQTLSVLLSIHRITNTCAEVSSNVSLLRPGVNSKTARGHGMYILGARGPCVLLVDRGFQPFSHTFPSWLTGCPVNRRKNFWVGRHFCSESQVSLLKNRNLTTSRRKPIGPK